MLNLIKYPLCREEDLGRPIPDMIHATSVCMPLWQHNVAYEELDESITKTFKSGYPRFFYHPIVRKLFNEAEKELASDQECCLVFPNSQSAQRCLDYIEKITSQKGSKQVWRDVCAIVVPKACAVAAKAYWQHAGEGICSRQSLHILKDSKPDYPHEEALAVLKIRLAEQVGELVENVYIFPSGMAAIAAAQRMLIKRNRNKSKFIQFGFPYVDTLKLLENIGKGVEFFDQGDEDDLEKLKKILKKQKSAGLFCEMPNNPLFKCPNLNELASIAKDNGFPLVVDDTIGTFYNLDLMPPADVLVSSLTKFFSGAGDVMVGSLVLSSDSEFYDEMKVIMDKIYEEDCIWGEEIRVLEANSRDFQERMSKMNKSAELVCDYLKTSKKIAKIYYPKFTNPENYNPFMKKLAGYGGIFSLLLNKPEKTENFFDALEISKGPGLGTNYSLACPYTILAHYNELAWAEKCGLPEKLIRISIGLEKPEELIERFDKALRKA